MKVYLDVSRETAFVLENISTPAQIETLRFQYTPATLAMVVRELKYLTNLTSQIYSQLEKK